jgi:molybdate transport system regulatory protein
MKTSLSSNQKITHPSISFRIDFGPESAVGPGKIALLEQIESTGSLSKAANSLKMSYARAWHLLDSLNNGFLEPVALTTTGGRGGGGATLTPFGKKLIDVYRAFHREVQARATQCFGPFKPEVRRAP